MYAAAVIPVSYTHLDVYKRQVKDIPQRGKVIVALCAVHSVIDSDEADTFLSVSYTHLDVYKRQRIDRPFQSLSHVP